MIPGVPAGSRRPLACREFRHVHRGNTIAGRRIREPESFSRIAVPRHTPDAERAIIAERPSGAAAGEPTRAEASVLPRIGYAEHLSVKGRLHQRLLDEINDRGTAHRRMKPSWRPRCGSLSIGSWPTEDIPLNDVERRRLADDLLEETLGVGPLAPLMADPAVTDILVNRFDQVYIERFGRLEKTHVRFRDTDHLVRIIQRIAARVGRRIDETSPMVDARLPDGSRVNATLPPVTLDGPTLSIRRFGRRRLRRDDLMQLGMFSPDMVMCLELRRCGCERTS